MVILKTWGFIRLAAVAVLAGGFVLPSPARACGTEAYIGTICTLAQQYCPEGYLPADGRKLPVDSYPALYSVLGPRFGGNGSVDFALPDMRDQKTAGGQYLSVCIAVETIYPTRGETMPRPTGTAPVPSASTAAKTCQDAQMLVNKMIAYYQLVGRDKAFAEFMKQDPVWYSTEQFGTVATKTGLFKAHPNKLLLDNPEMIKLKDVNGVLVIEEMIKSAAQNPGGGWAKYTWTHPETKKLAPRQDWVKVHDDLMFMANCYP